MFRHSILFMMVWGLAACAAVPVQTLELDERKPNVRDRVLISGVPFIAQKESFCGPATLAMVTQFLGSSRSMDELSALTITPGLKGTLQADLISAARRSGFMAVQISGMNSLLIEVNDHHPVIVFENLLFSFLPQWHYAVVFGYDISQKTVTMHSGPESSKVWGMDRFERSWMLGNYWGLVVMKPGDVALAAGREEHERSAVAIEEAGYMSEARLAYQSILKTWRKSLVAFVGLANLEVKRGNRAQAIQFLKQAVQNYPESEVALANLQTLEKHQGNL